MKSKIFKTVLVLLIFNFQLSTMQAQTPEGMSYQAVIRNGSDQLVTNTNIGMQISILQGSISGAAVYVETQNPTTNANGLISIEIGDGTVISGNFTTIAWSAGPYFIKTETDLIGGANYTITGISQLLSVPYALHAKTADNITGGFIETDPIFGAWNKSTGISITESQISDLGNYIETETDPGIPIGTQAGEIQYWNGSAWVTLTPGYNESTLTLINGIPTWIYELKAGEVENPSTGKVWMDRNLGALQVAISSTDADAYGDLYQWGRGSDGHQIRTSGTTTTLSTTDTPGHGNFITAFNSPGDWRNPQNHNLWQGVNGMNNPCPSGYRIPTETEWNAERTSWGSNNSAGAFASPLKLPLPGIRFNSDGSFISVGSTGDYWSSTVIGVSSRYLTFGSGNAMMASSGRAFGISVRCIKD